MMNITLNNGVRMPLLGFGTYRLSGAACEQAVLQALNAGYRLIDTAAVYGNEGSVGRAIRKSGLRRDELFVTTKFLPGHETPARAAAASLKKLGLDYIDLYLIHLPQGNIHASWTALEDLYQAGMVRAIGVSNFSMEQVRDLLQYRVIPAVNQVETHPFSQKADMQQALEALGIRLESWAPFAQGRNDLFNNALLKALSAKYRKSVAQVVLRWLVQREVVAIPKTATAERIAENLDVFDFELTPEDMTSIRSLDRGRGLIYDV